MDSEVKLVSDFVLEGNLILHKIPPVLLYDTLYSRIDLNNALKEAEMGLVPNIFKDSTYIINNKTYLRLNYDFFLKLNDWTPISTMRMFLQWIISGIHFDKLEFYEYAAYNS